MGSRFPSVLLDTGGLVASYLPSDVAGKSVRQFLEEERARPRFGHWYTVEGAVGEAYALLRREAGLAIARAFLRDLDRGAKVVVLHVPWPSTAALLLEGDSSKLGQGFTFVDASLVVAARGLGIRHVLTVNARDFRPFGLTPLPAS